MRKRKSTKLESDHPRSRGVYVIGLPFSALVGGSSPLARGLPWRRHSPTQRPGIIPARAGFTGLSWPPAAATSDDRDHPRSRGVYCASAWRMSVGLGSSPLARGLQIGHYINRDATGIIPARAGFTEFRVRRGRGREDHPRSRGVYLLLGLILPVLGGIIPARAGFTSARSPRASLSSDHPRSRGVYESSQKGDYRVYGSSPLARGLP